MTSVLPIPNTNADTVDGPLGSGHGFAIGITGPVSAANTPFSINPGGDVNGTFIGAGVTDMVLVGGVPRMFTAETSFGKYRFFFGGPFDGGSASYGDRAVISWSPSFGMGTEDRPLGTLYPVCLDNGEFTPSFPLQGFTGPSAIILGGSEAVAKVEVITLNSSTGDQSITGLGLGGPPDFLMFLGCNAFGINSPGRDGTNGMYGVAGYADDGSGGPGALTQWVGCCRSKFFATTAPIKKTRWHNDACIAHIGETQFAGATTVNQLASIVSMDSDGYTINLSQAGLDSAGVASNVVVIAVRVLSGNGIRVGSGRQGDTTLTPGYQPDAMLFASSQNTILGTDQATAYFNLGAMDVNSETSCWAGSQDGVPQPLGYVSTLSSLYFATTATLKAEANCTFPGSGPDVDLNWTTDDGSGIYFGWASFQIDSVFHLLPGCISGMKQIRYR